MQMYRLRFFFSVIFLALLLSCTSKEFVFHGTKQKGFALEAPPREIGDSLLTTVVQQNVNWVSLTPYAFLDEKTDSLFFTRVGEKPKKWWWGEQPVGITACIAMAKKQGLQVMLKPHIWLRGGKFTGDYEPNSKNFFAGYREYILQYAKLAQEHKVEVLCIGTELSTAVIKEGALWEKLIQDIREVYSGQLTYAENWDAYRKIPFWRKLDFIGVDAYFPLAEGKNPSLEAICEKWAKWKKELRAVAGDYNKPILFTELGYRYSDYATDKPWEVRDDLPENLELQANAYKAFFKEVWQEKWLAGVYCWKWQFTDRSDPFAFKNTPALDAIRASFGE